MSPRECRIQNRKFRARERYKKRDAFDCVPVWERMRRRSGVPPGYGLLLKLLHQGAVLRDFNGGILTLILKRNFVDNATVVTVARDVRDLASRSMRLDGFLHGFWQGTEFRAHRASRRQRFLHILN